MKKYIITLIVLVLSISTVLAQKSSQGCTKYYDLDNDGFGDINNPAPPLGALLGNTVCESSDCDDTNALINPDTYWITLTDADGDGFNAIVSTIQQCDAPSPTAFLFNENNLLNTVFDCDDNNSLLNTSKLYFKDVDGDGFGDINDFAVFCDGALPSGYVENAGDWCVNLAGTFNGCPETNENTGVSYDRNHVHNILYTEPFLLQDISNATIEDKLEDVTYFDGLGRAEMKIAIRQSPNNRDIKTVVSYDKFGRNSSEFLPYADNQSGGGIGTPSVLVPLGKMINYNIGEQQQFYHNKYDEDVDSYLSDADILLSPSVVAGVPSEYIPDITQEALSSGMLKATYSETKFDILNRVLEQAAPGNDWSLGSSHTVTFDYQTNGVGEVKNYGVNFPGANNTEAPELVLQDVNDINYDPNELYKTITKDENWTIADGKARTTEEFKDKLGRVILKRTYVKDTNGTTDIALDTQYVYDDFGNLTYVLSPEASSTILTGSVVNTVILDDLGYQYKYDQRNRLVEKKIPGKGWEYIVYDNLDRPTLTQDQNLKADDKWLFTKYDAFGRVTYTGYYTSTTTRSALQTILDARQDNDEEKLLVNTPINGSNCYYSNLIFPVQGIDLLTINYYDDYEFDTTLSLDGSSRIIESGVTEDNGIITKNGGVNAQWDAGFDTEATISGDGGISYTVMSETTGKAVMVGLTDVNNNPNDSYNTIGYAIYTGFDDTKRVNCHESGTSKYYSPIGFYQTGDRFSVERLGNQMLYKKNGDVFYASTITNTSTLVGDSSFLYTGTSISNVMVYSTVESTPITSNNKGLTTGSKVRVLGTNDWITTVSHYDEKARPIYVASDNPYLQTSDAISSVYDFIGNVTYAKAVHTKTGQTTILTEDVFAYDHQNRLLAQKQSINGGSYTTIAENEYDALGQLKAKKTGVQGHTTSENLANLVNVVKEGDYLTKVANASWTGNIESVNKITGDGFVEFTVTETEKTNMIGLSDPNGTLNDSYDKIDFAIYTGFGTTKEINIYEEGNIKTLTPAVYFESGDTFRVERDGTTIRYKKNGVEFASTGFVTANDLIADGSLLSLGSYIKDLYLANINIIEGQALQTVDYNYNIRGWLKDINDIDNLGLGINTDLFAFKLNYNTKDLSNSTELFNGNIAETQWKSVSDNIKHHYTYNYDALNRIKNGNYGINGIVTPNNTYDLSDINYDKNGNITSLNRNGFVNSANTPIDDLTYSYFPNTNQLKSVTDGITANTEGFKDGNIVGDDYVYDVNGNMTLDKNKNITAITYNHLNLPKRVTFSFPNATNYEVNGGYIDYTYDATGVKLKKIVHQTSVMLNLATQETQYAGNFVYEGNLGYVNLQFFNHPEGYIEKNTVTSGGKQPIVTTDFIHVYQYKDHLGNIRLSYADDDKDGHVDIYRPGGPYWSPLDMDGDGDNKNEIREESNYYPFGLKHKGYNNVITGRDHKREFADEEFEEELGKNTVAFQWRDYDPAIARFNKIDRFAEKYADLTPYHFTANNPIFFREIKGDSIDVSKLSAKVLSKIKSDLNTITGYSYSTKGNMLVYDTDENGNPIIAKDKNGNEIGSSEARGIIKYAIDHTGNTAKMVPSTNGESFVGDKNGVSKVGGDHIYIGEKQIKGFINGSKEVDNKTMGFGMMSLHEILHSNVAEGGAKPDMASGTMFGVARGPVVNRINKVRGQLNSQGHNYGLRSVYEARNRNNINTILFKGPFNKIHPAPLSTGQYLGKRIEYK